MAISYTWTIAKLFTWDTECCKNAVHEAAWKVTATEGKNMSDITGVTAFADPVHSCIDYKDLTEDIVITWIQNTLGPLRTAEIENAAAAGLATTSYSDKPLPWK